jgi:hypothetical protein
MKFRKKPVVIEAVQFGGSSTQAGAIKKWMEGGEYSDPPIRTRDFRSLDIQTMEGVMIASPGDWIIKGVAGEFYPCKPDIFAQTYEPAEVPQENHHGQ